MFYARFHQPTMNVAQKLYAELFNSVSADLTCHTDSTDLRMGAIYISLYHDGGLNTIDACRLLIYDAEMHQSLGARQKYIHQIMIAELTSAKKDLASGFNMSAPQSRPSP